jgi:hypothetical protein
MASFSPSGSTCRAVCILAFPLGGVMYVEILPNMVVLKGAERGRILNRCWCVDINLMLDLQYMSKVIGNVLGES